MRSVLISIRPKWCELIASGRKTVEVRKTKPKLETPFKVYIYCTNTKPFLVWGDVFRGNWETEFTHLSGYNRKEAEKIWDVFNGKVIGEFVCDHIDYWNHHIHDDDTITLERASELSCVSEDNLIQYADLGHFYAWHISDLVIYCEPRGVRGFYHYCGDNPKCDGCELLYYSNTECGKEEFCCSNMYGFKTLTRPPQSWCYVVEVE